MSAAQQRLDLTQIRLDGGTQPREEIDQPTVSAYAEAMEAGDVFPPLIVFFDGATYWLADGFHRRHAIQKMGETDALCDVREGSLREAILYAVGANAEHGRPRSNADKRRAVLTLLNDPAWSKWSDREIARQCRVGHPLVASLRPQPEPSGISSRYEPPVRTVARGGTTYTMQIAAIGRSSPAEAPVAPLPPEPADERRAARIAVVQADLDGGRHIFHAVQAIEREFASLPPPQEAAHRWPVILQHEMTEPRARTLATWFTAFADAWALREQGGADERAA